MNKNESKYFYTASLMDDALLELLNKKDFEFITVKEICQKASVSRSTFYLHYETMNDLLEETIRKVNQGFMSVFDNIDDDNIASEILTTEKFLKPYLQYIKDNLKVYKLMHNQYKLFGLKKVENYLYQSVFDKALTNYGVPENEKEYIYSFYMEGTLAIINSWIKHNCTDDIDFVINIITNCTKEHN